MRERKRDSNGRRNKAETKGNRRRFEEVQKWRVSKTIKGTDLSSFGLVVYIKDKGEHQRQGQYQRQLKGQIF